MEAALAFSPAQLSGAATQALTRGETPGSDAARQAARKAAEEFESVFLTTMLEGMFAGLKTDPPFGGGHSEKVYRSMLVKEYAEGLAKDGGIGLADHVMREILAVQESANR